MGADQFEAALFEVGFDQDVLIDGVNASPVSACDLTGVTPAGGGGGGGGGGGNGTPKIWAIGGVVMIVCSKPGAFPITYRSAGSNNNGPPISHAIPLPPTDEPGASLIGSLSGFTFPDVCHRDRLAFGLLMSGKSSGQVLTSLGGPTRDNLSLWACVLTFPDSTSSKALRGATDGTVFAGSTPAFVSQPNVCSRAQVGSIQRRLDVYETVMSNTTSEDELQGLDAAQGSFTMLEQWDGCIDKAHTLIAETTAQALVSSNGQCLFSPDTAAFSVAPCCNRSLSQVQCCGDTLALATFPVVKSITVDNTKCHHPDAMALILQNFVDVYADVQKAQAKAATTSKDDWSPYMQFLPDCGTSLGDTACSVDTDCLYTGSCNQMSGTCNFNWDDPGSAYAACHIDKMDPVLLLEISRQWNINPSATTFMGDFAAQLSARVSAVDCVGPTANDWQQHMVPAIDSNGNQYSITVAGNQTGCLLDKQCNWDPMNVHTEAGCTGTSILLAHGDHFCGENNGGGNWFQDRTQKPQCIVTSANNDKTACLARGAVYIWSSFGGAGDTQNQAGQCVRSDLLTLSACLPTGATSHPCTTISNAIAAAIASGTYSPTSQQFRGGDCSTDLCIATSATTQDACNTLRNADLSQGQTSYYSQMGNSWTWNSDLATCTTPMWQFANRDRNATVCSTLQTIYSLHSPPIIAAFLFQEGREFTPGQWSTSQDCAIGACNAPNKNYFGVTASQCAGLTYCTQSCARCAGTQRDGQGLERTICYDPAVTTQGGCRNGGQWSMACTGPNQCSGGACVYAYTRTQCNAASYRFLECAADLLNSTSCGAATSINSQYNLLGCQWNTNTDCPDAQTCQAQGRCNDWEFQSNQMCPPGTGFCTSQLGACVQAWQIDPTTGQRLWCQPPMGMSRLGCIDPTVTTSGACATRDSTWKWHDRAFTESACHAHGQGCKDPHWPGMLTPMARSTCLSCGGNTTDYYRWTHGVVAQGKQVTLTWLPRAWAPKNQWKLTISWDLMSREYGKAISAILARNRLNELRSKFGILVPLLDAIACDCDMSLTTAPLDCFTPKLASDCTCAVVPNAASTCTCNTGSIHLLEGSVTDTAGLVFNMSYFPAGILAAQVASNPTLSGLIAAQRMQRFAVADSAESDDTPLLDVALNRARELGEFVMRSIGNLRVQTAPSELHRPLILAVGNSHAYELVQNEFGITVGQIIGNMQSVVLNATNPIQCINVVSGIGEDVNTFPVPDFGNGSYTDAAGITAIFSQPLGLTLTTPFVAGQSTQLCATIAASGLYVPILRYINYHGRTPGNPAAATDTTAIIVGSVVGGLAGLVLLGLAIAGLVSCCQTSANGVPYTKVPTRGQSANYRSTSGAGREPHKR